MSLSPPKKRVTKDEKIAQLKSGLKISKEENARLKREIERLKAGDTSGGSSQAPKQSSHATNEEQHQKFREAMRSFKKVTVKQEMCIKTLRTKAKERRKELQQRDQQIKILEQKVRSLETAGKVIEGDQDLHAKIKDIQVAYDKMIQRNDNLEEMLDEKESKLESMQKQRNKLLTPLNKKTKDTPSDGESVGSGSLQSVSTESDFNVARLKTELAKKSEKILALQMHLDNVKDELYQVKQQKTTNSADMFGNNSNPFYPQPAFPMGQQSGDDWTDAEETDNESEFGEMQFGESLFPGDGSSKNNNKNSGDPLFQQKGHDSFDTDFW